MQIGLAALQSGPFSLSAALQNGKLHSSANLLEVPHHYLVGFCIVKRNGDTVPVRKA